MATIPIIVISLCVLTVLYCLIMICRNNNVYTFRSKLLKIIDQKSREDIRNNRDWKWRFIMFDSVDYDEFIYKFWVPLKVENFFKDTSFLK